MSDRLLLRLALPLALVGVASASLRYLTPHDLHVALTQPIFGTYATEQLAVLREHPAHEHAHRLGGIAWMALGLAQLLPGVRSSSPALHRWLGRTFVLVSLVVGLGGAAMGALFPYVPGERLPSVLAGTWMALTAGIGMAHARGRRFAAHRAWMVRCLGVGLGISVIRVFAVALTLATDIPTTAIVTPTFWAGWLVAVVGAEGYLRRAPALIGNPGSTPRSAAPPPGPASVSSLPGRAARTASR